MPTAAHLGPAPGFADRAATLFRNRWLMLMLIACGVMALVVVSVVGFSGAYFTSRSTSPDNAFTAATIKLAVAKSGELVDGSGLYPGAARVGAQTVTNNDHTAAVTLSIGGLDSSAPLARALKVVVTQTMPSNKSVYDGPLTGLGAVALGTFEKGEARSYQIAISWPPNQADASSLQGASINFSFDWLATSIP